MKTIGGAAVEASSRWSSSPLIPGSWRSNTKHPGLSGFSEFRNSDAEPNTATRSPFDAMRLANASRTRASSSTTNTTGSSEFMRDRAEWKGTPSCQPRDDWEGKDHLRRPPCLFRLRSNTYMTVVSRNRKGKREDRADPLWRRRDLSAMCMNDRSTDCEPHAHPGRFRCEECVKDAVGILETSTVVSKVDDRTIAVSPCRESDLPWSIDHGLKSLQPV